MGQFRVANSYTEQFRKHLPQDVANQPDSLQSLWTNVQQSLQAVARDFAFRYIVVFGVSTATQTDQSILEIVARAGDVPQQFTLPSVPDGVRLDIDHLPPEFKNNILYASRKQNSALLRKLVGCDLDACGDLALVFLPVPLHPQSSIAILVGYGDGNPSTSRENLPGGDLDLALQAFDTLIVSSLSAILAATAQRHTSDQLRILGHETGQLIAGLDWMRVTRLESLAKLRALDDQKAELLCLDIEGIQKQLYYVFQSAHYLIRAIPPVNKEHFWAFGDLLYRWKNIYRLEAKAKSLVFNMGFQGPDDPSRPKVYGDHLLLEQLLYNLVSNAVKYCFRGTNIHLDCQLSSPSSDSSPHLLTVVNYGPSIPKGDRVYELYWRADDSKPGLGIGLFIASQIANAHGGAVRHTSVKLSDYNIPLLQAYLDAWFRIKGHPLDIREALRGELARLTASGDYDAVVAMNDQRHPVYSPSLYALMDEIRHETYKVTMTVELPRFQGKR